MFCEGIYIDRTIGFGGHFEACPIIDGEGFAFDTMMDAFRFCREVKARGKEAAHDIYREITEGK